METGEEKDTAQPSTGDAQAVNGTPQVQDDGKTSPHPAATALTATSSSPVDAGDGSLSDRDTGRADVSLDSNGRSPEVAMAEKSRDSENSEEETEVQLLKDGSGDHILSPPEGESGGDHDRPSQSTQQEIQQAEGEGDGRGSDESKEEEEEEEVEEEEEETRNKESVDSSQGQPRHEANTKDDGEMAGSGNGDRRSPSPVAAAATSSPREKEAEREQLTPPPEDDDSQKEDGTPPSSPGGQISNVASDQGPLGSQNFDSDDGDLQSGEVSAREPNATVQGMVQDVLEKVLAAGAGMVEDDVQSDDDLGDGMGAGGHDRYPELEKVELSSDDESWDGSANKALGRASLQQSDSDGDKEKENADMLMQDSEQPASLDRDFVGNQQVDELPSEERYADADESEHADSPELSQQAAETRHPYQESPKDQGKPGGDGETGENEDSRSFEHAGRRVGADFAASPKPEYPLNYKNYEVCRVVSPGVRECLILETGEQVLYDCRTCSRLREVGGPISVCGARHAPQSAGSLDRERVKRDLFSDKGKPPARSEQESVHRLPQDHLTHSPPSYSRSAPLGDLRPHADHASRHPEASVRSTELEDRDSHDGSYLWMRQQIPSRTESREVLIFTNKIPREGHFARETTHSPRERTSGSPSQAKEMTRSPREKAPGSPRREGYSRESGRQRESRIGDRSGSSVETSRTGLSQADVSGSVSSPGAIPNFKTLQDQQVSWLAMYRMLEEEHRGELQAQYVEHQRMISDMQRHLDRELLRQQQSVQQKLEKHREALSSGSPRQQSSYQDAERTEDSRRVENVLSDDSDTEATHQKQSGRSRYERTDIDSYRDSSYTGPASSQRSPEGRPTGRSPREERRSRSEQGREKRLRGGVYSSPMPISRSKASSRGPSQPSSLNSSVRESGHLEGDVSNNARVPYESGRRSDELISRSRDLSLQEDDVLSPRTRTSLREKHAKHLADLRAYYETEIQELRDQLNAAAGGPVLSSSGSMYSRESASERILREENQSLRHKCQDLQDALDDAKIRNRELEQRLQGLEIRAADYAERYEESQNNVLKLKNRLEELHAYAKEREAMLEEAQARERQQKTAFEALCKAREEQEESVRRDKSALKRLLDKYETLEKEYTGLKETVSDLENKLYDAQNENSDLNKIIARLELENKRLSHDNDNMLHRLASIGSFPITRQEVEGQAQEHSTDRLAYSTGSLPTRHQDRSLDRLTARSPRREVQHYSDNGEEVVGKNADSPLLKAERELRRLQESMGRGDFVPKLQPKKYSSIDSLTAYNGYSDDVTIIDGLKSSTRSTGSVATETDARKSKPKKSFSAFGRTTHSQANAEANDAVPPKSVYRNKSEQALTSVGVSSPTRFDVGVKQSRSTGQGVRERESSRERLGERTRDKSPATRPVTGKSTSQSVDATLERIRTGDIVSRPQWEDVYTSLAKPRQQDNKSASLNMTQEEMLRERIRTIEQLEHRYDELTLEKRKLESQLNKIPTHGRDRKSRREKELLEEQLDKTDHELGSLRMTLKRYQVLKTTF